MKDFLREYFLCSEEIFTVTQQPVALATFHWMHTTIQNERKKNKGYRAHISILFFHFGCIYMIMPFTWVLKDMEITGWPSVVLWVFFFFFWSPVALYSSAVIINVLCYTDCQGPVEEKYYYKFWKNYLFVMY